MEHNELLRKRTILVASVLEEAGIPYAVIGGFAVKHYVGLISPGAARNTADVDMILNRDDLESAANALVAVGFRYRKVAGVHLFLDGPKAVDGVHVVLAGEKVRPDYAEPVPSLDRITRADEGFNLIPLDGLVRMKLTSYRIKDKLHLLDMIGVGLLPGTVMETLTPVLQERLQVLLDNPDQ